MNTKNSVPREDIEKVIKWMDKEIRHNSGIGDGDVRLAYWLCKNKAQGLLTGGETK